MAEFGTYQEGTTYRVGSCNHCLDRKLTPEERARQDKFIAEFDRREAERVAFNRGVTGVLIFVFLVVPALLAFVT